MNKNLYTKKSNGHNLKRFISTGYDINDDNANRRVHIHAKQ